MSHPLHQFVYCPKCGAKTFIPNNEKSNKCTSCGFVYYFNPSAAVACFILNSQNEILLVRRAKDPAKGTLDLPGGFVDMHESGEESAKREVKEETGLEINHCEYLFSIPNLYMYSDFEVQTLDMFFLCKIESFTGAKAEDDAEEIVIMPIKDLNPESFGLYSVKAGIQRFKDSLK